MPRPLLPLVLLAPLVLAGCKPSATDDYVARTEISGARKGPAEPIGSPDVEGAIWAPAASGDRLLYGKPGEKPLLALECRGQGRAPMIGYTRFVLADAGAKGILALIGNGHVERFFVDAKAQASGAWLWQGAVSAADPRLEVLTGRREVEATIPGAGSVKIHPSALPGDLITRCRQSAPPRPAATAAPAGPNAPLPAAAPG